MLSGGSEFENLSTPSPKISLPRMSGAKFSSRHQLCKALHGEGVLRKGVDHGGGGNEGLAMRETWTYELHTWVAIWPYTLLPSLNTCISGWLHEVQRKFF